jgi:hypothetical protein
VSWEEQKWSVNGDGPCPNEVIGAPSSGKNGAIIKGGRHSAGSNNRTHNIRKSLYSNLLETPNTILNLKSTSSFQVCTPSWIFSPPNPVSQWFTAIFILVLFFVLRCKSCLSKKNCSLDCYELSILILGHHLQKATITTRPTSTAW